MFMCSMLMFKSCKEIKISRMSVLERKIQKYSRKGSYIKAQYNPQGLARVAKGEGFVIQVAGSSLTQCKTKSDV